MSSVQQFQPELRCSPKTGRFNSTIAEQFAGASKTNYRFTTESKEQYRMKKLIVFLLLGCLGSLAWAGEQKKDVTERLQLATDVLSQMTSAPDKGIPEEVLDSAKCIAVVPHLV